METNVIVRSQKGKAFLWVVLLLVIFSGSARTSSAAIIADTWDPVIKWDSVNNHITRNGNRLAQALPSTKPGLPYTGEYNCIEDIYLNNSIAHSGSAIGDKPYQHVYAYRLSTEEAVEYATSNVAKKATPIWDNKQSGVSYGKSFRIDDQLELDGSILVVNPFVKKRTGVLASFDVLITREFECQTRKGPQTIIKKLAEGKIELIAKKNGKVAIKTSGKIKKGLITSIQNESEIVLKGDSKKIKKADIKEICNGGDLFRVDLANLIVPYKFYTRTNDINTIEVQLTSNVNIDGFGTGAEVCFFPAEPMVPAFQEQAQVPEPATFVLLLVGGGLIGLNRKGRRSKRR
ncbi:MAG: PEP-CTERM sorting domain-containing protein, partial [Candidatus Brocadiia bacterium]